MAHIMYSKRRTSLCHIIKYNTPATEGIVKKIAKTTGHSIKNKHFNSKLSLKTI